MEAPVFASRSEWITHTKREHGASWPWRSDVCPICSFLPLSKSGYVRTGSQNPSAVTAEAPNSPQRALPRGFAKLHHNVPLTSSSSPKSVQFNITDQSSEPVRESSSQLLTLTGPMDTSDSSIRNAVSGAMLNHIADHLQFLALLTPRLSTEKLAEGDMQESFSSQVISNEGSPYARSTLDSDDDLELPGDTSLDVL